MLSAPQILATIIFTLIVMVIACDKDSVKMSGLPSTAVALEGILGHFGLVWGGNQRHQCKNKDKWRLPRQGGVWMTTYTHTTHTARVCTHIAHTLPTHALSTRYTWRCTHILCPHSTHAHTHYTHTACTHATLVHTLYTHVYVHTHLSLA
jgi:hypothetical protein